MQQAGTHVPTPYPHLGFQSVFRDHPRPRMSNSTGAALHAALACEQQL